MAAKGAAGGAGEALPLFEGEAAVFADRRGYLKMEPRPGGPGKMAQVIQHLLFGEREVLGDFQGGAGLLQEQLSDGLAGGSSRFPGGGRLLYHG